MLENMELSAAKPSCHDCLAWSRDGEMAFASGEHVILLLPQRDRTVDRIAKPWIQIRIKVNEFTHQEWPPRAQRPTSEMNLGEEQSNSHVIALAWSEPGIALHRRSVLAILTANYLLSIWTSGADPRIPTNWTRVLVVNNVLAEKLQQSQIRITAVYMARVNSQIDESGHPQPKLDWGPFICVVADDSRYVRILNIRSPYSSDDCVWAVDLHGSFRLQSPSAQTLSWSLFRKELERDQKPDLVGIDAIENLRTSGKVRVYGRLQGKYTFARAQIDKKYPADNLTMEILPDTSVGVPSQESTRSSMGTLFLDHREALQAKMKAANQRPYLPVDVYTYGQTEYRGFVATCLTWQNRHEITYKTAAEEACVVAFCSRDQVPTQWTNLPWQEDLTEDISKAYSRICARIIEMAGPTNSDISYPRILYSTVMIGLTTTGLLNHDTAGALRSILGNCAEVFNSHIDFGTELALLDSIKVDSAESQTNKQRAPAISVDGRVRTLNSDSVTKSTFNQCPVPACEQAITWGEGSSAYCLNGHPFGQRCAITFLPILEPRQTKSCEDCRRPFLDQRALSADSTHTKSDSVYGPSGEQDDQQETFAERLLSSFDVCPYCSGKFYAVD